MEKRLVTTEQPVDLEGMWTRIGDRKGGAKELSRRKQGRGFIYNMKCHARQNDRDFRIQIMIVPIIQTRNGKKPILHEGLKL